MPKLSQIAPKRSVNMPVVIEGETVNLDVAVNIITPNLITQMQKQSEQQEMEAMVDFLVATIKAWDIVDDKNVYVPITAEVLSALPIAVLTTFSSAVMDAITSGNAETSPA